MQSSVATRTAFSHALCLLLVLGAVQAAHGQGSLQVRAPLPVPDLPGYKTLKGDFHLHTVFSDGLVWPTVRVVEAWRDGLDVIAITDHTAESRPHGQDVNVDGTRSYALARPVAEQLGLILIQGVEITKMAEHGREHFNALFVTDPNALNVPDMFEALRRGARPGRVRFLEPSQAALWQAGVVPGYRGRSPGKPVSRHGVGQWEEILCGSLSMDRREEADDRLHERLPRSGGARAARGIRPITLLFVRTADAAGVREALFAAAQQPGWATSSGATSGCCAGSGRAR